MCDILIIDIINSSCTLKRSGHGTRQQVCHCSTENTFSHKRTNVLHSPHIRSILSSHKLSFIFYYIVTIIYQVGVRGILNQTCPPPTRLLCSSSLIQPIPPCPFYLPPLQLPFLPLSLPPPPIQPLPRYLLPPSPYKFRIGVSGKGS